MVFHFMWLGRYNYLGSFQQDQVLIVVRNLSVECLLGADFLVHSEAILDCKVGKLSLKGIKVPITMGTGRSSPRQCLSRFWKP